MAVEDFTTYTETDPDAKVTKTSTRITIASGNDNNTYNVYKDFGASHFNSLDIDFAMRVTTGVTTDAIVGIAVINSATPSTENMAGTLTSTDISANMYWYNGTNIFLNRGNFAGITDSVAGLSIDTTYYCTLVRSASSDTVTLEIYSDSGRTSLVDTLSVSGFGTGTTWQYVYGFMNAEFNESNTLNGYVENMDVHDNVSVSVSASVLAGTFSIPAPTVTAQRHIEVASSVLTATFSLPPPSVVVAVTVSPSPLVATFSLPSANIITPDVYITPSPLTLTFTIPAPVVSGNANVTATLLTATFSLPSSVVTAIANITISPEPLVLTLSIPTARITGDIWANKFVQPETVWSDRLTPPETTWADKF